MFQERKRQRAQRVSERLQKLYGAGTHSEKILAYKRRERLAWAVAAGIALILLLLRAALPDGSETLLQADASGNLQAIKRPPLEKGPTSLSLTAVIGEGEDARRETASIMVYPQNSPTAETPGGTLPEPSPEQAARMAIQKAAFRLSRDTAGDRLILPGTLEDGTVLRWSAPADDSYWPLALIGILLSPALLRIPERRLKKEEKDAERSILRELPGFVNRLVLLMDAGMVLEAAIKRIALQDRTTQPETERYFYAEIARIARECTNTNRALHQGLREFALRSRTPEFLRLTNLICDSSKKGVDLMGLLTQERDSLWFARRKMAEQQGRMSETKLTLPLMILLLVLVLVTIAPAMLEM